MPQVSGPTGWDRAAAVLGLVPAVTCAAVGVLLGPEDLDWAPAWAALSLTYLWVAGSLWMGRAHARAGALGLALGAVAASIQGMFVVGPIPLLLCALVGHLTWTAALWMAPRRLGHRHRVAVGMATLALPCAIVYGLAPQSDLTTTLWMLGSAALVWVAALGISSDRTWGLLLAPFAAVAVSLTVWDAPSCGCLENPHALMPQGGFAVAAIGVAAAALSVGVFVLCVGPIVRWVRTSA